jgi:hypothetical protein
MRASSQTCYCVVEVAETGGILYLGCDITKAAEAWTGDSVQASGPSIADAHVRAIAVARQVRNARNGTVKQA